MHDVNEFWQLALLKMVSWIPDTVLHVARDEYDVVVDVIVDVQDVA